MMDIVNSIEIISMADVPAGTGLGSSSCYAVGLLNALHVKKRNYISLQALAEEAFDLEVHRLGKPIGKQDQYMAAFGGLTILNIHKGGEVGVISAQVSDSTIEDLNQNLLMFYTGTMRSADTILSEQSKGVSDDKKNIVDNMHYIKNIGYQILAAVESGNITDVGLLFDQHWEYKKKISSKMTNNHFDEIYRVAKENGALGGKITGAGGGGFFVFYVENNFVNFRHKMKELGLREMRYRFDFEGSKVLVNFMNSVQE